MVLQPADFDPTTGTLTGTSDRVDYWWIDRTCIPTSDPDAYSRRTRRDGDARRGVDRDNRGAELAIALFTGQPRPTTSLDLLFGGYLVGTLVLLSGGLALIGGSTVLGIGTVASPVVSGTVVSGGTVAAQGGSRLGTVLSAIRNEYALTQPTTIEGAWSVIHRATASLGLETGIATEFSASGMVLQNVGGVITQITATGGITIIARGATVLQLGQ
jgi:hypothetical protein